LNRNDKEFIEKNGQRKAFHTGGNSSCRLHIRQHYTQYQELCKQGKIPEHHWAVPRTIWNERQAAKKDAVVKQGTLDKVVGKTPGPLVFNREDLLHAVTQFIAVDDQVRLTVDTSPNHLILASRSPLREKQHFEIAWLP
jgi:hypothetical protein